MKTREHRIDRKRNFALGAVIVTVLLLTNASISFGGVPAPPPCDVTIRLQDNIQSIVNARPPGTTFCFEYGTYRLTAPIVPKSNNVFVGNSAVLNGSRIVTSFSASGSRWVARNVVQPNPVRLGDCLPVTYSGCVYPEAVFIDHQPLWQVMSLSEVTAGRFYVDYNSNDLYIGSNPQGRTVELSIATRAFRGSGTNVENVAVRGFSIEKFANEPGVGAIDARNTWMIAQNNVYMNQGTGVSGGALILDNYIHHNGYSGLSLYKTTGSLVQGNEIYANNTVGFNWDGTHSGAGGSKFGATTDLSVIGNYVHDNLGPGLWTDGDNLNTLYAWNRTRNNHVAGILHEVSLDAVIRNNISENDGANPVGYTSVWWGSAISVNGSRNVSIYGNTVVNGMNGIGIINSERGYLDRFGRPYRIENLAVYNNLIVQYTGTAAGMVSDVDTAFTSWNNWFYSNTYQLSSLSGKHFQWMNADRNKEEWMSYGKDTDGVYTLIN